MTPREIKAFAAKVGMDREFAGKQVVVRSPSDKGGLYLTKSGRFDGKSKADAARYDYEFHRVGEQVQTLAMQDMNIEVELA